MLNVVVLISSLKIEEVAELFDANSLARINAKFFQFHNFFVKNETKFAIFSPFSLDLQEVDTLKLQSYSEARKRASCTPAAHRSLLHL